MPELTQDLKDVFRRVVDLALKKKVNYLFIVGDLFDTNKPSPDLIKFVREQVTRLVSNGIVVSGIAGDHDKPINDSAWVHLSGVIDVQDASNKGLFVGYDYSDNSQENIDKLAALPIEQREKAEWIFLHGQVPELFMFTTDKKKLDIKSLDIINTYPNLKGVVLGDIHTPISGVITDPAQKTTNEPWIGYCGSLGVIKTDEIGTKEGILYWDGDQLIRLPFEIDRKFIRLNIADSLKPINWVVKYHNFFRNHNGKKPIFIVEYDKESKKLLPEAAPLYEVGIVKTIQTRKQIDKTDEVINIRSELKTNNHMEAALKDCTLEQDIYDLILSTLVSDDPKVPLDQFKELTLKDCQ